MSALFCFTYIFFNWVTFFSSQSNLRHSIHGSVDRRVKITDEKNMKISVFSGFDKLVSVNFLQINIYINIYKETDFWWEKKPSCRFELPLWFHVGMSCYLEKNFSVPLKRIKKKWKQKCSSLSVSLIFLILWISKLKNTNFADFKSF